MRVVGRHVYVDVWGADPITLNNGEMVLEHLRMACLRAGATILHSWYRQFKPQGVTALVGLAESHASIHTYPEYGYYAADMFTCGNLDPRQAMYELVQHLGGEGQGWYIARGDWSEPVILPAEPPVL